MGATENLDDFKHVWQLGFGDDIVWVNGFFEHYSTPGNRYAVRGADGSLQAQMHVFPIDLGGVYIYGVTTHPAWRGRGVARAMIDDALCGLAARGVPFAMLIAQEPSLCRWYGSMGFCLGHGLVDVEGYDGECLCNESPVPNHPMWRVVNAQSYMALYMAQGGCGTIQPFYLTDTIAASVGSFTADGRFLPGERLPGARQLAPAGMIGEFPIAFPTHIVVADPHVAL